MQAIQDEGRQRSSGAQGDTAQRLDENPNRIELKGGGWPSAIAHCNSLTFVDGEADGITFVRLEIPELFFSHAASILLAQGMPVQDFFPPDTYFAKAGKKLVRGPFVYLAGELSPLYDPPMRLQRTLFAALSHVPEGLSREEVLSKLFQAVQGSVRR